MSWKPKTTPYGGRHLVLDNIRDEVLQLFESSLRPILIGPVSLHFKCSLAEAERILEELREEGAIRLLTESELRSFGLRHGYVRVKKSV